MPRFYALDFDRTLGHTKNIATEFTDHVGESDASAADVLRSTQRDVEASGGSFDIFSTLRTHMGGRALGELVDGFYERPQRVPFLEDGALVEFGPTQRIFTRPAHERTEAYITGRFG